jgi:hypothetical protein
MAAFVWFRGMANPLPHHFTCGAKDFLLLAVCDVAPYEPAEADLFGVARQIGPFGVGVKAERVPLAGAARYRGNGADVDLYVFGPDAATIVCEVKARASGEGFATLERWLGDAPGSYLICHC